MSPPPTVVDADRAALKFLNVLVTDSSSSSSSTPFPTSSSSSSCSCACEAKAWSSFKESWLTLFEDKLERILPLDEASLRGRSESLLTPESARDEELLAPELFVGEDGGDRVT